MKSSDSLHQAYELARETYAAFGVDTDQAIAAARRIPLSLHCWQADDVRGFEVVDGPTDGGGILATGAYPGRARTGDEIRADLDVVLKLAPGPHRLNLHASYAETGGKRVDRDRIETAHFSRWMDWSKARRTALDFNPTYFAHPKANDGMTLSHPDAGIREFWIAHGRACRRIGADFGRAQGSTCVINHWAPDGAKDHPADRWGPRARLRGSLDAIFAELGYRTDDCLDAVEGKLFGIGSEDYVVGSHEFYYSYAQAHGIMPCLDLGHYHPTESVADKISALLLFHRQLLLHTSRPIRWDSDHVVIFDDAVQQLFLEVARGRAWDRIFVALDFFDASINRLAAYVIGARATRQAILFGLLDPTARIVAAEQAGRNHERLALSEQAKALPWGAVWDQLCAQADVPVRSDWLRDVAGYEAKVLAERK